MQAALPEEYLDRLRKLEQQLAILRARVEALERRVEPRTPHPLDKQAVVERVRFDWQQ